MHNLPKVSVCFLTYNSERDNLKESLKNLLKLKYKNIEFIISDDNSTDKSFEICKEVKKKSKKIIFLNKNKQNLGSWMNYYKAINLSKGDYVFWACPNDFYAKNFVSESVNKLIKKDKFVACGTTVYDINEKGHVLQKRDYKGEKFGIYIVPIIFQLLHFYFDMFFWRFSNEHTQKNLAPYLFIK